MRERFPRAAFFGVDPADKMVELAADRFRDDPMVEYVTLVEDWLEALRGGWLHGPGGHPAPPPEFALKIVCAERP